jgi:hypothetical protein
MRATAMIEAGYMARKISAKPDWIKASGVVDICSVSYCISEAFCHYIGHWKHNGYWFFDSPSVIREIASTESIDLSAYRLFYYEVYELQFDEERRSWQPFEPDRAFTTQVEIPARKQLLGFDVVSFDAQTTPECSPLSCNNLAESIEVNEHCLLPSLESATRLLESGAFDNSEPGPFRVLGVYSCGD